MSMSKDNFCKAFKEAIGRHSYTRKRGVRGYEGFELLANNKEKYAFG